MPRTARAVGDSGIYHVMLRGINQQRIFEDDEDRDRFLEILKKSREKDGFDLIAWCLMPNHVHLLIKENEVKLGTIFRRIRRRMYTGTMGNTNGRDICSRTGTKANRWRTTRFL